MRFRDVNGDGAITEQDRTVLGSANTPYTYGLTAGISYKGFDFNLITNIRPTLKGSIYRFVYDYGYLELDNDFYLIVRDKRLEK